MNGSEAFDDLTLGEVEEVCKTCLGGKAFSDDSVDPLMLAGAIMWITNRKTDPTINWDTFKQTTSMRAIRQFSEDLETAELLNPTNARNVLAS